jgi:hypothetical protein
MQHRNRDQRDPHQGHRIAELADRLADPQQPERALPQQAAMPVRCTFLALLVQLHVRALLSCRHVPQSCSTHVRLSEYRPAVPGRGRVGQYAQATVQQVR